MGKGGHTGIASYKDSCIIMNKMQYILSYFDFFTVDNVLPSLCLAHVLCTFRFKY